MLDIEQDTKAETSHIDMPVRAWSAALRADSGASNENTPIASGRSIEEIEPVEAMNRSDDRFTIIWVQNSAATRSLDDKFDAWIKAGAERGAAPMRAGIRTIQVTWTATRVLMHCASEHIPDALDAITRFTELEFLLERLDRGLRTILSSLDKHTPWTRAPNRRLLRQHCEVDRMAEMANGAKVLQMQIQSKMEQLDPVLSSTSKRLFAELADQALAYARLELAEQPIQFALDHYEIANSRIIEAKNALWDKMLSLAIIALLAAEFFAMIANGSVQLPRFGAIDRASIETILPHPHFTLSPANSSAYLVPAIGVPLAGIPSRSNQ